MILNRPAALLIRGRRFARIIQPRFFSITSDDKASSSHAGGTIITDYARYRASLPGEEQAPAWAQDRAEEDRSCGRDILDDEMNQAKSGLLEDIVKVTAQQIGKILWGTRDRISPWRAWYMYQELPESKRLITNYDDFVPLYKRIFIEYRTWKRRDTAAGFRRKKSRGAENPGYEEPEFDPPIENSRFTDDFQRYSLCEDVWKANNFESLTATLDNFLPDPKEQSSGVDDSFSHVFRKAYKDHLKNEHKPVFTGELADFDNAYMMKKSAMNRLLHEYCVRNKLDESMVDHYLDNRSDLIKLRSKASMPPEVLEPLMAFRGDRRWSYNSYTRLGQKLDGIKTALSNLGSKEEFLASLPETIDRQGSPTELPKDFGSLSHPYRNHLGFESEVPDEVTGSVYHGRPLTRTQSQLRKSRYPTLQRVANRLPADPAYRSHVVHSIRVLERSKSWGYDKKVEAVNKMKEIYDTLAPSEKYRERLDEKFTVNRVNLGQGRVKGVKFQQGYPKHWRRKKCWERREKSPFNNLHTKHAAGLIKKKK